MSATPPMTPSGATGEERDGEAPYGRRADGRPVRRLIAELQERREEHKKRNPIIRVLYVIVAATVVLIGIVMLVTPGPAFVIIPIGLTLLALEFASAERLLDRALDQADAAKNKARESTKGERILVATAAVLAGAAFLAAALYWDIPYLPV